MMMAQLSVMLDLNRCTMKKFRVVVAGGREFNNYPLLVKTLDKLLSNKVEDHVIAIVCGGARGADSLGLKYANERGYQVLMFKADWDTHGKSAGYKRNSEMADNSDATVAFWDGLSRGTKHMIDLTHKKGNPCRVCEY